MTVICLSCGCVLGALPVFDGEWVGGLCQACRAEAEKDVEEQLD